ncbi:MAG: hypothetical protein V4547_16940 [Bacteroidota bacterium]
MGLSDIILKAGECIVIKSDSTLGLAPNGVALNFGSVQAVNELSHKTSVGQSIMFDESKATPFMIISGTTFYLVKEDDITFYETVF